MFSMVRSYVQIIRQQYLAAPVVERQGGVLTIQRKEIFIMKTKLKDMSLADWFRVVILLGFLLWIVGEMTGVIEHRGM